MTIRQVITITVEGDLPDGTACAAKNAEEKIMLDKIKPLILESIAEYRAPWKHEPKVTINSDTPGWLTENPPRDGRPIVALGSVICRIKDEDGEVTTVNPLCAAIRWIKDGSGFEGWHYVSTGMCVQGDLEDEVKISHWSKVPQ